MIHEEICTFEVCKLAKEKGFDLDCPMLYNLEGKLMYGWAYDPMNSGLDMRDLLCHNSKLPLGFGAECTAPTQSLLQRWLREEKGVTICVDIFDDGWFFDISTFYKQDTGVYEVDIPYKSSNVSPVYDTYELALEDALQYALLNLMN